ncbi:MAG: hypothetical protein OEZ24_05790, partial [Candidatus Bathyarchaeota archaeon]|nr:hypothetical protein [Candidatus Bathyarchaeota archaeon]
AIIMDDNLSCTLCTTAYALAVMVGCATACVLLPPACGICYTLLSNLAFWTAIGLTVRQICTEINMCP